MNFGPDKSLIIRGIAIIFMIILHNNVLPEFKICVPIFTFLVGYGYHFAKQKNVRHGLKRIWHLLSYFWLILLGVFLPIAIWKGNYNASIYGVFLEMFGLESYLNWFSWYIYFYIFAMFIMIPTSRIIDKTKIGGVISIILVSFLLVFAIHQIPNWSDSVWLQAVFDSFLVSPTMYVGYYLASNNMASRIQIKNTWGSWTLIILIPIIIFFLRGIPYISFIDFVTVPIFVMCIVALFNLLKINWISNLLMSVGKESMNMWFLHALFFTSYTAIIFMPLLAWLGHKILIIVIMIVVSYYMSKLINSVYSIFTKSSTDQLVKAKSDMRPKST